MLPADRSDLSAYRQGQRHPLDLRQQEPCACTVGFEARDTGLHTLEDLPMPLDRRSGRQPWREAVRLKHAAARLPGRLAMCVSSRGAERQSVVVRTIRRLPRPLM